MSPPWTIVLIITAAMSCFELSCSRVAEQAPSPKSKPNAAADAGDIGLSSPCELALSTSQDRDWIKEWSPHFVVERRGALVKVIRQGDNAVASVKESLSDLRLDNYVFVQCKGFVLLWMPCGACDGVSSGFPSVLKSLGDHEVLHIFNYMSPDYYEDCLAERLPLERCRAYAERRLKKGSCEDYDPEIRKTLNKLMIKLGYAKAGSRICLRQED